MTEQLKEEDSVRIINQFFCDKGMELVYDGSNFRPKTWRQDRRRVLALGSSGPGRVSTGYLLGEEARSDIQWGGSRATMDEEGGYFYNHCAGPSIDVGASQRQQVRKVREIFEVSLYRGIGVVLLLVPDDSSIDRSCAMWTNLLEVLFGPGIWQHVCLTTTHVDPRVLVDKGAQGTWVAERRRASPAFASLLSACGGRILFLDHPSERGRSLTSLAIKAATPALVRGLLSGFKPPIEFGLGADPDLLDERNMVWGLMRDMKRNAFHRDHLLKLENRIFHDRQQQSGDPKVDALCGQLGVDLRAVYDSVPSVMQSTSSITPSRTAPDSSLVGPSQPGSVVPTSLPVVETNVASGQSQVDYSLWPRLFRQRLAEEERHMNWTS